MCYHIFISNSSPFALKMLPKKKINILFLFHGFDTFFCLSEDTDDVFFFSLLRDLCSVSSFTPNCFSSLIILISVSHVDWFFQMSGSTHLFHIQKSAT